MSDTHTACDARIEADGGQAQCCMCVAHDDCELGDQVLDRFDTEMARQQELQHVTPYGRDELTKAYHESVQAAVKKAKISELERLITLAADNAVSNFVLKQAADRLAQLKKVPN